MKIEDLMPIESDPLDIILRKDDCRDAKNLLLRLRTHGYRQEAQAVYLHEIEGLPYREIGEIMGLSLERARQYRIKGMAVMRALQSSRPQPTPWDDWHQGHQFITSNLLSCEKCQDILLHERVKPHFRAYLKKYGPRPTRTLAVAFLRQFHPERKHY